MRNRMPNLLTALAALGCGGTPGAGGAPGSCDFRAPAAAVRVTVTGAPATFETLAGEAMNTLDLEARGPLPPARQNALARGPCGTVGLAYRRTVGTAAELAYLELGNDSGGTPGTAQTVASGSPGLAFSLFFEPDCTPVIAHPNGNGMVQHRREGGRWTSAATSLDLRALTGQGGMSPLGGETARDGRFHLYGAAGRRLVHGARAAAPGSAWTFEVLHWPQGTEIDAVRSDGNGAVHAVYRNQVFPCDPSCDVTLYHARLQAGAWVGDVVQPGTWGPPLDLYAAEPSLAFDALERPVIAGHFLRRVETGSIDSSELRVFLGGAATFCNEAAVTANDGYVGGDGTKYTGADPAVALDRAGRVHVLFLDQAKWHDGQGYENEIRGQLRYAVNGGGAWSVSRLVSQPGQSASPNPLIGYRAPQFVLSADGTRIVVVAVETSWATNSIYNPQAVPATYRAQVIYGTIGP